MIAGFERPDAGRVRIGGRTVAGDGEWVEPEQRRIGMVFQQGALFPHLDVAANVGFGAARRERVGETLELVGLGDRAKAYPHELSGGERQRVALARALAADPEVILLDEPFAALDAGLRETLREEVAAILRAAGASALLVTHDQAEALSLADEVAVLRDGRVVQTGSPEEVYDRPSSRWVAEFLGEADVLPGTAEGGTVRCELGRFSAGRELSGEVQVVIRPESVAIGHGVGRVARRGRGRRARALLLRPRPARAPRAALRAAAAQPPARLPRLASGRPRARVARRAGERAAPRRSGPASRRAARGRARRCPRRTAARRRSSSRCG